MNTTEIESESIYFRENLVAGLILLILGLVGCYFNIRNCIIMSHLKEYKSAFGYLCIFRSICNIANLIPVITFTAPETLLDCYGSNSETSRVLGLISGAFYLAIPFVQLAVAFNRFVALFLPFYYNKWFTLLWAKAVVITAISFGTLSSSFDLIENCRFVYELDTLSWDYLDCPRQNLEIVFNYPLIVLTVCAVIINSFTISNIIAKNTMVGISEVDGKFKKNLRLFWQGVLQELFFVNDMMFNTYLGNFGESRIWLFISYTLMWTLGHTLDGVIFYCFNRDLRRRICDSRSVSVTFVS